MNTMFKNEYKESITVEIELDGMDDALKKANHLVKLLREAKELIDSLGNTTIINNNN